MIDADELRRRLSYDRETGVFIWRLDVGRARAGMIAGADAHNGYRHICIQRHMYMAHRLAWLYVYGKWPEGEIDHANGIKSDNRIANLREATRSQNMSNKRGVRSSSGFRGVFWHKKAKRWQAHIRVNGTRINLGLFDNAQEASAVYTAAAEKYFGAFMPTE